MILIVLFWILFILWAANGFWSFLPQPLNHLILVVLLAILGFKVLGNPVS